MPPIKLGELLKQKGRINETQFEIALAEQAITGELLGEAMITLGFVSHTDIAQCLAEQSGIPFLDISGYNIPEKVLHVVHKDMAQNMRFIPLDMSDGTLTIGITDPDNLKAVDKAAGIGGKPPKVYLVDADLFEEAIEKAYYFLENPITQGISRLISAMKSEASPEGSNISSLVDYVLQDAIRRNASDVHITPTQKTMHVYYRIDGVLQYGHCLPLNARQGIITRIKILAKMDIAEQRVPQFGIFSFNFLKRKYNMRVSTIPTLHGEDISLRVLIRSGFLFRITNLGYEEDDLQKLRHLFSKPHGLIIVSGPTGGGKTTTLFAALREMDLIEKNVLSVEDPIEYRLSMIKQTEASSKVGYTYAMAGRCFLRHDPDVILVGEIIDEETAKMAVSASTTGHLVLSTLHTNDAPSSIPRLTGFAVDKNDIATTLIGVIGQRLVRKICNNCKEKYALNPGELAGMGFPELEGVVKTAYRGRGCSLCNNTGYLGRTAIGEILLVDDEIKFLISSGAPVNILRQKANERGFKTMRDNGIRKAEEGITTFAEILRVIG
ncbi:MAG: Flp pilus assembly complex ATPase component TadA [Nitrospirae bacterium]|nr:Flp pilus assembly complex ATPase component TadA [Nitrospirota bacterium]